MSTAPESNVDPRRKIAEDIARAMWVGDYKIEHPAATPAKIQEEWRRLRSEHIKNGMRVLNVLEAQGYRIDPLL